MLTKLKYTEELNVQEVYHQLQLGEQPILIKNFPLDDLYLENFVLQLGEPVIEARNIRGKSVFNVEVSKQNNFFRSIANSNIEFPLHTDCADFKEIPNCIALLCVQPATETQGTSRFTSLSAILEKLSPIEIKLLTQKQWLFRNKQRPILQQEEISYSICYDRITMETFAEVSKEDINLLHKLDALFNNVSFTLFLEQSDLILFRNDLLLHGRSGFDLDSRRLLKRVRLYLK
ncbi:TauD/TfdA family dioxygenase [uncultured Dokdonia sp.]|uniref:TauD/TfdA family dioxygenase n=1 Tax=uncultured Dokdonia sp. TaxID=575653 RepID=UPI002628E475|nr:TauD/TfdA family dioxygenase [uncultured Dokdonia sp.]